MPLIEVGHTQDFPPGAIHRFQHEDAAIVIINDGLTIHAFRDHCPHAGATISDGYIVDCDIVCSSHYWSYRIATGEAVRPAVALKLQRLPITVDNDMILLELP